MPPVREQALPAAEDDREDHQPVLVHEVVLHQRLDELAAAVDQDVAAVGLLQLGHLAGTSSLITVELFQVGSPRVLETTYLGMLLNLSANSPSREGHAAANPS